MNNIEFVKGVQCQKCGNIIAYVRSDTPELCQKCGADLIYKDLSDQSYNIGKDGKSVTVKVTHKFFKDVYEIVD